MAGENTAGERYGTPPKGVNSLVKKLIKLSRLNNSGIQRIVDNERIVFYCNKLLINVENMCICILATIIEYKVQFVRRPILYLIF